MVKTDGIKDRVKLIKKTPLILKNIAIFNETQSMCKEDVELSKSIIGAQYHTEYYSSDQVDKWEAVIGKKQGTRSETNVTFSHNPSFTAAGKYARQGKKVAVLNFANAQTPGGGVTIGAIAQEECLCRSSTLYPVLSSKFGEMPRYYAEGRMLLQQEKDLEAGVMYHPGIIVFREDRGDYRILKRKERFQVDVITCAAPNLKQEPLNNVDKTDEKQAMQPDMLYNFHMDKGRVILGLALKHGVDVVILGAFGCGAFRNDPRIVAKVYRELVNEYDGYFEEMHFAIYGEGDNYGVFEQEVGNR